MSSTTEDEGKFRCDSLERQFAKIKANLANVATVIPRSWSLGKNYSLAQQELRNNMRKFIEEGNEDGILECIDTICEKQWRSCLAENLADAINFFCNKNDLETTERLVDCFKANCKIDWLDKWKTLKYTRLLIDNGRIDDAITFLEPQPVLRDGEKDAVDRLVARVLRSADRVGDAEKIGKLREVMLAKKYL